jgi:hypothetical protein
MAYSKRGLSTQGGADTFVATSIDTNLTADGKAGWEIVAFSAYFTNGETGAAADSDVNAILATQATVTTFEQDEEIYRINWSVANTAGVAVAYPVQLVKREILVEPRLTVQPTIYVQVSSSASGLTCAVAWEFHYNIVKLTDIEVLRLLQGGV